MNPILTEITASQWGHCAIHLTSSMTVQIQMDVSSIFNTIRTQLPNLGIWSNNSCGINPVFIEKILDVTIILGIFSRIAGAIVGLIESYIIIFILLFAFSQPFIKVTGIEESKLANFILDSTPIMSSAVSDVKIVLDEIDDLSKKYKNDKTSFNEDAIKLFIKYDIISEENINYLRKKGKI